MSCAYLRLNKVICGYFTAYWSQCVFLLVLNVLSRTDYDRNTAFRFWNQSHNARFASHWQPISQSYIRSKRRMAHRPPGFRNEGDFSPLTHATAQCHLKYVFRNSQYPLCSSQFGSLYLYFPLCFPSKTGKTVQILDAFLLEYHLKPEWSDEWGQAGRLWWVTHISAHFSFFLLCHCESRCLLGWWWSSWLGTYPSVCTANNILTLSARVCWICVGLLLFQYKNQNWTSCSLSSPGNGLQQISINSHWLYVYFLYGLICSSTATDWPCSFLLWRLSSGEKKVCEKRQHTYF